MKNLQNLTQIAENLPIFVNFLVKVKNLPFLGVFGPKICHLKFKISICSQCQKSASFRKICKYGNTVSTREYGNWSRNFNHHIYSVFPTLFSYLLHKCFSNKIQFGLDSWNFTTKIIFGYRIAINPVVQRTIIDSNALYLWMMYMVVFKKDTTTRPNVANKCRIYSQLRGVSLTTVTKVCGPAHLPAFW